VRGKVGLPTDIALTTGPAPALVQVQIDGPVLLLMGPIGLFFARFCDYLRGCGIPVTKVAFPLQEFGFPAEVRVPTAAPCRNGGPS